MTLLLAEIAFVAMAVGWFVIRYPHARRARRTPVIRSARTGRELLLLTVSLSGLGILPFIYVVSGVPRAANYPFHPALALAGVVVAAVSLAMFHLTHRALGRNWSVTLEVRESHRLVTDGIYRHVRHPMYTGFWLWAVAQALLLPNWVAGVSGLVGFGTLYAFRITSEERLMLETFGDSYRDYSRRTARLVPWLH